METDMSAFRMEMKPTFYRDDGDHDWEVQIFRGKKVVYEEEIYGQNYHDARAIAEETLRDHSTVVYAGGGGRPSGSPPRGSRRRQYLLDVWAAQEVARNLFGWSPEDLAEAAVQAMYRRRGWEIPN